MKVLYFNGPQCDFMSTVLIEGFNLLHRSGQIDFRCLNQVSDDDADFKGLNAIGEQGAILSTDWAEIIIFDSSGSFSWMSDEVRAVFENKDLRKTKMVFVDGTDNQSFVQDPGAFVTYFKREIRYPNWNFRSLPFVRSLNFGMLKKHSARVPHDLDYMAEWNRREIDISFVAQNTNGLRLQFASFIGSMSQHNRNLKVLIDVQTGKIPLSKEKYIDILKKSKIAISCPGVGWDTKRFWEIPGCGAVLASYDLTYRLQIRDNFEGGRHCIYFESLQQAFTEIMVTLSHPPVWCMMRAAADQWSDRHTSSYRAQQLIGMAHECKVFSANLQR